jgi:ATP-dependent Clp protease ATP-binding subunit ClpA
VFERFDDSVKRVVVRAQELCIARADEMIGSEHLMLAAAETCNPVLVSVGLLADVLQEAWDRLESDALAAVGVDPALTPAWRGRWRGRRHIPFSGSARDALRGALREALDRDERQIRIEHLMLALTVQPPQDRAVRILGRAGIPSSSLRAALVEELKRAS